MEFYELIRKNERAFHEPTKQLIRDLLRSGSSDGGFLDALALAAHELAAAKQVDADAWNKALEQLPNPVLHDEPGHAVYTIFATHHRFHSKWVEDTDVVRVNWLKKGDVNWSENEGKKGIETKLGWVYQESHLAKNLEEIQDGFATAFGRTCTVAKVELITGPTYKYKYKSKNETFEDRFSPISVYLAYEAEESNTPVFYALESGGFTGQPGSIYYAQNMGVGIHQHAGFKPTPFSNARYWYHAILEAGSRESAAWEPGQIHVEVSKEQTGSYHFQTTACYTKPGKARPDTAPLRKQFHALLREAAIAQQLHYDVSEDPSWAHFERAIKNLGQAKSPLPWMINRLAEFGRRHFVKPEPGLGWLEEPFEKPGISFSPRSKQLGPKVEPEDSAKTLPYVFYESSVRVDIPKNFKIILAGNNVGDAKLWVDDILTLKFEDGTTIFTWDFSNGNSGRIMPHSPFDITKKFEGHDGTSLELVLEYKDQYPNKIGASEVWLCFLPK